MPFELTWERGGVYRRYFDDVTIEERECSFDLICGDVRFDGLRYTITDYLDVKNYEVSVKATEEIAARHIAPLLTNPSIVIAAVAVDRRVIAAIEQFISLQFISQPYEVFRTVEDARAWIACQRRPFDPPRARQRR